MVFIEEIGQQSEQRMEGILCELDHNRGEIVGMSVECRKSGSWKRRARASQAKVGKENVKDQTQSFKGEGGKRGFELRDEVEAMVEGGQFGKKINTGGTNILMSTNMVEVASHEWSQCDQ